MTIIVCAQQTGRGADCPECGGALHRSDSTPVQLAGGPMVCGEGCAVSYTDRQGVVEVGRHLHLRDLLCACPEVCAPRGLPTPAMRKEAAGG